MCSSSSASCGEYPVGSPDRPVVVEAVVSVLRKHEHSRTEQSRISSRMVEFCMCGWRSTFEHRTHAEHVAAAVIEAHTAALGGLPLKCEVSDA